MDALDHRRPGGGERLWIRRPLAAAAAPAWLRHALHRTRQTGEWQAAPPPVARYTIDEGGVFVLDPAAPAIRWIKFDDKP